jgi:hypothetical protein
LTIALLGCAAADGTEGEASEDALRADPNAVVKTQDPTVRLLGSFNSFLDRAPTTRCIKEEPPVNVGDVRGEFFLRHVSSREELAKELDVDIGASLKLPKGSVDASAKVVNSFKRSATSTTFVVRAVRSYAVTPRGSISLTDEARALLDRNDLAKFMNTCGGSFVKTLRYEAQVIGLMQFEAKTEEAARNIETALSGSGGVPTVASASGTLKAKAIEAATKNQAQLTLTLAASGFLTRDGGSIANVAEHTFEKIDELRADMDASVDLDLKNDREAFFANGARNARPRDVLQGSYAQLPNAPSGTNFTRITTTLARAEEFFAEIAGTQVRMETIYGDELDRFLTDTSRGGGNPFRYNILPDPQLQTSAVVPIAQRYAALFRPLGLAQPEGTLVQPLRMTVERCLTAAGNGDYSACTTDRETKRIMAEAVNAVEAYATRARVVPLVVGFGNFVSYRNAEAECAALSMRLAKHSEMTMIAPAVTALAGPGGEVWFAPEAGCAKPVFTNDSGQGAFSCGDTALEPLPYVEDRPAACVGLSGPVPVLPRP